MISRCFKLMLVAVLLAAGMTGGNAAAQTPERDVYIVQPGDTLWIISQKYKVPLSEVIAANPQLQNPNLIYPGDKVVVPLAFAQLSAMEAQVVQLVNAERAKRGLPPLAVHPGVTQVARAKSQDMRDRQYFSHTSPTYGSPFQMLKTFGITYRAAGENIAAGQPSPAAVMQGWMNSPGHRENILNPQYTHIGVGLAQGGSYRTYWTQLFIRP